MQVKGAVLCSKRKRDLGKGNNNDKDSIIKEANLHVRSGKDIKILTEVEVESVESFRKQSFYLDR